MSRRNRIAAIMLVSILAMFFSFFGLVAEFVPSLPSTNQPGAYQEIQIETATNTQSVDHEMIYLVMCVLIFFVGLFGLYWSAVTLYIYQGPGRKSDSL